MEAHDKINIEEIMKSPCPLEGNDEHKLEYIKYMIEIINQDKRRMMLFISFIFGTLVLIFSQLYSEIVKLPYWLKIIFCVNWIILIISASLFYRYWRRLHITNMQVVRCIPSLNTQKTRELWAGKFGVYQTYKHYYKIANFLMVFGYLLLFVILFFMLLYCQELK